MSPSHTYFNPWSLTMIVITGIVEDTQFNAVRKKAGWEVTQCDPHTGKQLTTVVTDMEFGATLALLVAGDSLEGVVSLYTYAEGMVAKQREAIFPKPYDSEAEEQAVYPFRMIP